MRFNRRAKWYLAIMAVTGAMLLTVGSLALAGVFAYHGNQLCTPQAIQSLANYWQRQVAGANSGNIGTVIQNSLASLNHRAHMCGGNSS